MKAYRPLFIFVRLAALMCAVCLLPCLGSCAPVPEPPPTEVGEEYTGKIFFEGRRYTYEGESQNISAENDALVIKKEGSYLLTGKLSEGRIVTDAPWVRLVLDSVELCSSVSSVIESRRGTLIIESGEASLNVLRAESKQGQRTRGAIHSGGDLFICGKGKTVISAPRLPYAVSCGRIFAESGELSLTAHGGIITSEAKISGGKITVNGAKTGIYAYGSEYGGGTIEMSGGSFVAICQDTALLADEEIKLTGGERDIRAPKPYVCIKDNKKEEDTTK